MADSQRSVSPAILIVGGLAIVAAAIYALWAFVLSGNGSAPTGSASTAPSATVSTVADAGSSASAQPSDAAPTEGQGSVDNPGADPSEEGSENASQVLPETFEVYTARNPFEPLIKPRQEGANTGGTTSGFPSGGGSSAPSAGNTRPPAAIATPPNAAPGATPGTGTQPSPGSAADTSTSAGTGAGGQVEVGATRVRLQSVQGADKAVVTVNGVDYNPTVGEQFAQRFKLLSVNKASGKDCATLLFGDSRFSICAGQVIDK